MDSDLSRLDSYEILRTIGHGVTSKVKLGRDVETGEYRALKILKYSKALSTQSELSFFNTVPEHPNIIKFFGFKENATYTKKYGQGEKQVSYMGLELAQRGEIFDFVANLGAFPEPICRYYYKQMLTSLETIHASGITHRDIKPENIFIGENYDLKVADFGFSTMLAGKRGDSLLTSIKGTLPYMAPEILEKRPYRGDAADLFASAIICFILNTGLPPFRRAEVSNPHYQHIFLENWPRYWNILQRSEIKVSEEFKSFIQVMLCYQIENRLTLAQIWEHPWVTGPTATQEEVAEFMGQYHTPELEIPENPQMAESEYKAFSELSLSRVSSRQLLPIYPHGNTHFCTASQPDDVFRAIHGALEYHNAAIKIDPADHKLIANMTNEDDESKLEVSMGVHHEKYCVEVTRLKGFALDFANSYRDLIQELENQESC